MQEREARQQVFRSNLDFINQHNSEDHSYKVCTTSFLHLLTAPVTSRWCLLIVLQALRHCTSGRALLILTPSMAEMASAAVQQATQITNCVPCLQVALNEYADLTWDEFRSVKLGLQSGHDGSFR